MKNFKYVIEFLQNDKTWTQNMDTQNMDIHLIKSKIPKHGHTLNKI